MIKESFASCESEELDPSVDFKTMTILAVATSIDALAVGVTLAFLSVNIIPAVSFYRRHHIYSLGGRRQSRQSFSE